MNLIQNNVAIISFILLCTLEDAHPILCYDCNSAYDPRCGADFDSFSLGIVNCSLRDPLEHLPYLEPTLCRSTKIEISGKIRVVRQCGYIRDPDADDACRRRSGFHEMYVTYCSCSTDLCNPAVRVRPHLVYLFVIVAAVISF